MIAFRAEARRWAKYVGAPADVVRRAHVYRECIYGYNERSTATVEDADGEVIWLRRLDAKRTAARAVMRRIA